MGCLNGIATRVSSIPVVTIDRATEPLTAIASRVNDSIIAEAIRATISLSATAYSASPRLKASVGLICSINGEAVIQFAYDKLTWNSTDENQIGITKYNLLTASGDWVLEEIEELL